MFIELILFTLLGVGVGTATGLIPGVHPNTILAIILSSAFIFSSFPVYSIIAFIVSVAVANSFTEFIQTILLGVPEAGTELSVLPGHQMVLEGRAYEALFSTVVGGIGVVLLTILAFPVLLTLLPFLYNSINSYIHYILIFVVLWMIISEKNRGIVFAASIFLISGLFGMLSLNSFASISIFPALTGMFGVSGIILSLSQKTKIPKQDEHNEVHLNHKGIFTGWLAGLLVGILPGIGSSQAGVVASNVFKSDKKDFLVAEGSINTSNLLFTFIAFFTLEKTRSGAAAAISQILATPTLYDLLTIMSVAVIATFIAAILTIKLGKIIIGKLEKINYKKINISVIVFLVFLVLVFSGLVGLLILVIGTFLGLLSNLLKIKRSNMMGFFLLPTILYFSGLLPAFSLIAGI